MFKLAFYLVFFCAFRVLELISRKLGDCSGILFEDVLLKLDSIHILLRKSNIDPLGRRRTVFFESLSHTYGWQTYDGLYIFSSFVKIFDPLEP